MRRLYLLRHASSGDAEDDHDRPLLAAGLSEARAAAAVLRDEAPGLARIVSSTARRARETAACVEELIPDAPLELAAALYLASPDRLLGCVEEIDDGAEAALVVAHNPGIAQLARALCRASDPRRDGLRSFPPASLVGLAFEAARWVDVGPGEGRCVLHWAP